jgi:signal transduction histidine kinase
MLHQFLIDNRDELISRTREKVGRRDAPRATKLELTNGVPLFLSQLTEILEHEGQGHDYSSAEMGATAIRHGNDLLRMGFTVAQVVHDYGDVCQAVTELALDQSAQISTQDFHTLNRCLDNAIAEAVTEYGRQREKNISEQEVERVGFFAHELRNLVSTATLSYQMLRKGNVPIGGSTGAVLGRCLTDLRELTNRSLVEVRLASGSQKKVRINLAEIIEEAEVAATMDADKRELKLIIGRVEYGVAIVADRMVLSSALANLLQNAFKFTRAGSRVQLHVRLVAKRVLIEVEDECGGLPPEVAKLFEPYWQTGADQEGMGLGLAIARRGVEANGGELRVRDIPGKGCVFTIDLPLAEPLD